MKYVVDSNKMKQIDDYTREVIKIPALVLMERAAMEIVNVMKNRINKSDRILVVCGPGNNGGDGVAAGRILYLQGYQVALFFVCKEGTFSRHLEEQVEISKKLGMLIENNKPSEYNIIIDAIFGVGLSRPITGYLQEVIKDINASNNEVYSVDIPSGISADTGKIMNAAVKADYTITFGYMKQGTLLYPGADYAGEITVADIGFPEEALLQSKPNTFYYTNEDLQRLPIRTNYSNKGTYGKVLVIAGSKGMSGAAYLSAKAAYRTGAGLVKILTSSDNRIILQTLIPEALFSTYDPDGRTEEELQRELIAAITWASVIVIGPGLGKSNEAEKLLTLVINKAAVPMIVDADALNILAEQLNREQCMDTRRRLERLNRLLADNTIITPHLMELSRLIKTPISEITDNIIDTVAQCSYNNKLIYVIKDARTIVAQDVSKFINLAGNNGMATGGCGDVLTGIIAGLVAQGLEPYAASCLAVYIHGLAGDVVAEDRGTYSMMSGDLIEAIDVTVHSLVSARCFTRNYAGAYLKMEEGLDIMKENKGKYYRVQARVDLNSIKYNLLQIRSKLKKDTMLMVIIKADAYGHGAVPIAKALNNGAIDAYGVAILEEAIELRDAGIKKPILVLGYTPVELYEQVVSYDVTQTIFQYEAAEALSVEAEKQGKKAKIHIKIDTGMSRLGYNDSAESIEEIKRIYSLKGINIEGIFTHFARADETDITSASNQLERFL
ncbi:MAG TPA: NAD(P)H-hydrate dehydratase, partial [Mobilitalea sp.]|nr:NAD(P)H-hydrate dehydratase [Mobilitalea sp.]